MYPARMRQLESSEHARARPVIPSSRGAGHLAFAHGLIEGALPGRVFVDDQEAPRSALFCPDNGFYLATGVANAAFADEVIAVLQADWLARLQESRLLVATDGGWAAVLRTLLPVEEGRLEFHHEGGVPVMPELPAGYRLEPLTEASAAVFGSGIDPWVVRTMGGPAAFARSSFGTVILADDGTLASACVACGVGGGEAEIEIGTDPRHRRRGLAAAAGAAFISACVERGLVPAWTCSATNEASIRCAMRLGFAPFRTAPVFPLSPLLIRMHGGWRLANAIGEGSAGSS